MDYRLCNQFNAQAPQTMTTDDLQYISRKIREDFDSASDRFRGDFQRYEFRMELIERAHRLGLCKLAEEMRMDERLQIN